MMTSDIIILSIGGYLLFGFILGLIVTIYQIFYFDNYSESKSITFATFLTFLWLPMLVGSLVLIPIIYAHQLINKVVNDRKYKKLN